MQYKFDMFVVNRIIFDLCFEINEFILFDNKIVCFCENFKQYTFVCSNVKKKHYHKYKFKNNFILI